MLQFEASAGKPLTIIFEQLDGASPPNMVSGQSGFIMAQLRDEDGPASEPVTIIEQGSSGFYEASFTPNKSSPTGFSYHLALQSPIASTDGARLTFDISVFPTTSLSGVTGQFLTTLANVKEFLAITDTTNDGLLTNLIARVSRMLEARWGRRINAADYDEKRNGMGDESILVRAPINSIASLYQSLDQVWNSGSLISASDYLWSASKGIISLKPGGVFLKGFENVRAVYNAGFVVVPPQMEDMAIRIIANEYRTRGTGDFASMSLKDGSYARRQSLQYWPSDEFADPIDWAVAL